MEGVPRWVQVVGVVVLLATGVALTLAPAQRREAPATAAAGLTLTAAPAPTEPAPPTTTTITTTTTSTTVSTTTSTTPTTTAPPQATGAAATSPAPPLGTWAAQGRLVRGQPAVWTMSMIPPGGGPPVGVARLDEDLLRVVIYAGTTQPGGSYTNQGSVPPALQPQLVAAFNGGFQFGSSEGGFLSDGRENPPLRAGAASLVVDATGIADVVAWQPTSATTRPTQVRQNLTLLVDHGAPTPLSATWTAWGATLSHTAATWRSAVGADDHHDLYFVGGPGLTPAALAQTLAAAGAQRAMELDINPQWVLLATYTDAGGTKLLPGMYYAPDHFFSPNWRDFVAVFAR